MSFAREKIVIGGNETSAHLTPLDKADRIRFSPATHRGACIAIPGVEAGMTFLYAGVEWKIIKAWDEAAEASPEVGARRRPTLNAADVAYYKSRKGKFIDLLLIQEGG